MSVVRYVRNAPSPTDDGTWSVAAGTFGTGGVPHQFGNAIDGDHNAFFLFLDVTVPNGATINSAVLRWRHQGAGIPGYCKILIHGVAEDDATPPADLSGATGKPLTLASIDYEPPSSTTGAYYNSPDLTAIIQEVVNRPGWTSGYAMCIYFLENGSDPISWRVAEEGGNDITAPRLTIEFAVDTPPEELVPPLENKPAPWLTRHKPWTPPRSEFNTPPVKEILAGTGSATDPIWSEAPPRFLFAKRRPPWPRWDTPIQLPEADDVPNQTIWDSPPPARRRRLPPWILGHPDEVETFLPAPEHACTEPGSVRITPLGLSVAPLAALNADESRVAGPRSVVITQLGPGSATVRRKPC